MIWVIANRKEEDGSFPTYKYYKQAFEEGKISIYCADESDHFGFIQRDDTVIVRTRNQYINEHLRNAVMARGFRSTIESSMTDLLTHDKEVLKVVLQEQGIPHPVTVSLQEIRERLIAKFFIKPRYGENSIGVDEKSGAVRYQDVLSKCLSLMKQVIEPMVEEFIPGDEVTTVVIDNGRDVNLQIYSAIMKPNTDCGYHTEDTKQHFDFVPQPYHSEKLDRIVRDTFHAVRARHILRIDSRIFNGVPYIIDVNMIPGLAPDGYLSKCMEVNGISYYDAIRMMVNAAY